MQSFSGSLALLCVLGSSASSAPPEPENRVVHEIPASKEYPRNSEGSFATLKDGTILFVYTQFTGGKGDHATAQLAGIRSNDGGITWGAPKVALDRGTHSNLMSVSLLRLRSGAPIDGAQGRLAMFYLAKDEPGQCHPWIRTSADEGATWSEPVLILPEPGYFVLNNDRVIQLASGRLVVPVAHHPPHPTKKGDIDYRATARWFLSDDEGKTWREAKSRREIPGESRTGLQEPGVVERADGSLWCFTRTDRGRQYGMTSTDGGETWSEPKPTELKSPLAPASVERIPGTDDLLAVWCEYAPGEPIAQGHGKRTPLMTAISPDGGRTWPVRRALEEDPEGAYCYTAIHFVGDQVLLAYCAGDPKHVGLDAIRIRKVSMGWFGSARSSR